MVAKIYGNMADLVVGLTQEQNIALASHVNAKHTADVSETIPNIMMHNLYDVWATNLHTK
jgi:hypothetical protein